ncbi:MAG: AAA family ATPase, partial [Nocardioides sp.]
NTLIEAELVARLGLQFAPRDATPRPGEIGEKRAVREIVGVDDRLAAGWSRRSRVIERRRRKLAVKFQTEHGRPPLAIESIALAQQATLETRQAKHAPRSEVEQRTGWRAEATRILGSPDAIGVMVDRTLGCGAQPEPVTDAWIQETARLVVDTVQANRATWQTWHLRAEAHRRVREHGVPMPVLSTTVDEIVDHAVTDHSLAFNDPDPLTETGHGPDALRRADGVSVYVQHESRLFTSRAVVAAEQALLAAARRGGGRRISDVRVGIALAETAANGITLNAAQAGLVRELATSGARLQVALAPAGTGKTIAMEVLARAWRDGGGRVVGLAPSAVAATELNNALNTGLGAGLGKDGVCDTLSKLVWSIQPGHEVPAWVEAIDAKTLVMIDEAAMASTIELNTAVRFVLARGGCVRLVGDDRQLAAVAAGGVLRDIAATVGAVTLSEVRRFADPAEAAATLAVRDGDPAALGFYADRGRIHVGDLAGAADQAYRAWTTDTAAGKQSLLLAPTRELVAELNTRARTDRLARNPQAASAPAVRLGDGTLVSAGDTIITRRNHRGLRISSTDWVKNGDRWTVHAAHADGSITASHQTLRSRVRLPHAYVRDGHVQLGYATTVHGAQGTTVETSHTVLTGEEDRSLLYVAVSRGRASNHVYLGVGNDGDPHHLIRPETLIPPTALDQLTQILGRDRAPTSATTALRQATDPAHQLHDAAARYHDTLTFAAEQLLGTVALDRLETTADLLCVDLTHAPAWPTLRSHLALLSLDHTNDRDVPDGVDPVTLLRRAIAQGGLDDAADPAAVIDSRLPEPGQHHPGQPGGRPSLTPWLPAIPAKLAKDLDWGPYLSQRQARVDDLVSRVRQVSHSWTPGTAPGWAQHLLAPEHEQLRAAVAVWRAVHGVGDSDLRPTGPRQIGTPGRHQGVLARAARAATGAYPFTQRDWYQALSDALQEDPWITVLCQRLARLERAGLPVGAYLHDALTQPRPLPDQHAAAALWWRLCAHLGPAALQDKHAGDLLRPPWLPTLAALLPHHPAEQLAASSAWPALVAAVDEAASRHHWDPDTLLSTAAHALPPDLHVADLTDALVLRVAILTDPPDDPDDPDTEQPDPPEDENLPPDDLDQAPPPTWLQNTTANVEIYHRHAPAGPHDSPAIPAIPSIPRPAAGAVARGRIVELHGAALEFYAAMYPRSWAPGYLRGRLGSDLTDLTDLTDPTHLTDRAGAGRVAVGYAPPGPT